MFLLLVALGQILFFSSIIAFYITLYHFFAHFGLLFKVILQGHSIGYRDWQAHQMMRLLRHGQHDE